LVWRDAGKADSFDATQTYYYLPLSGYVAQSKYGYTSTKEFVSDIKDSGVMPDVTVYGVRKSDLEFIKTQTNWINIEDHVANLIGKIDTKNVMGYAIQELDDFNMLRYNERIVEKVADTSPYKVFVGKMSGVEKVRYSKYNLERLFRRYNVPGVNIDQIASSLRTECENLYQRYPLFSVLRNSEASATAIAEYINLIDSSKGV
jgi:hypothetical protein